MEKCFGHSLKNLGPLRKLSALWGLMLVTGLLPSSALFAQQFEKCQEFRTR